ncbi:RagB/SusD family nutrient uptake outer membrane protein [Hymenobacter cellulosivorans]|uniref:RagB/SusD family nutrient uptake outer membrane protein n=1 Tax=Hymenobacter cellulosivorans TaxID=2932249 RepID=A0ABY4FE94_9BACT|nr:RagB/SusD family nutrient uptake outer membrane protein [Hymenobacter cellulosivorans]UOQ54870.1 RagB/SusD family nutrient uptake outer membrane protein [Hymenobacter cellulosivorans]
MKKSILLISLLSLGLGLASCEKFLEEKPYDFLSSENFYQNEGDAVAGLNGVFNALLPQTYFGRTGWQITELPADLIRVGSATDERAQLSRFTFTPTNTEINSWWTNTYRMINRANDVIEKVPGISMDVARRNNIVGNARFLRAMGYFDLVRCFGDVPLVLATVKGPNDDLRPTRTPLAQVYEQIIEDLKFAEANCYTEDKIAATEKGRVSSGAATALLAKVYITRATTKAAQGDDNKNGLDACNRVIGSKLYSLLPVYGDVFNPDKENGPEHIFSIQFDLPPNTGSIIVRQFLPSQLSGLGTFTVEDSLVRSYAANDVRRAWNISNQAGTTTLPRYYFNKFRDEKRIGNDARTNYLITRYADILLLQSEALNALNAGDATKYQGINAVRVRAGLAPIPAAKVTTKDAFVDLLVRERAWELVQEGHRWFDLVRLNRLKQREKAVFNRDIDDRYFLFPIPQPEMILNPNLTQNNGYSL